MGLCFSCAHCVITCCLTPLSAVKAMAAFILCRIGIDLLRKKERVHAHTCIHACMHACMHAYIHTCIHTYIITYIHTYIHKHIHSYIHTYKKTARQIMKNKRQHNQQKQKCQADHEKKK